jgi:hypothetical protein
MVHPMLPKEFYRSLWTFFFEVSLWTFKGTMVHWIKNEQGRRLESQAEAEAV